MQAEIFFVQKKIVTSPDLGESAMQLCRNVDTQQWTFKLQWETYSYIEEKAASLFPLSVVWLRAISYLQGALLVEISRMFGLSHCDQLFYNLKDESSLNFKRTPSGQTMTDFLLIGTNFYPS